jgi:hypothetical protein
MALVLVPLPVLVQMLLLPALQTLPPSAHTACRPHLTMLHTWL